jgi:phosphopantetheinyl transferase
MGRVIVLHAPSDGHVTPDDERRLLRRLPYARRLALEARAPQPRRTSLAATMLAIDAARALGFAGFAIENLRFPQDGKPHAIDGPWFSITHTTRVIACAASDAGEIGIDVEERGAAKDRDRLARWTAIEAALKAAGLGLRHARQVELDAELRHARVGDAVYRLTALDLGPGRVACLGTAFSPESIDVRAVARIEYDHAPRVAGER